MKFITFDNNNVTTGDVGGDFKSYDKSLITYGAETDTLALGLGEDVLWFTDSPVALHCTEEGGAKAELSGAEAVAWLDQYWNVYDGSEPQGDTTVTDTTKQAYIKNNPWTVNNSNAALKTALPVYADNAAAIVGGLEVNDLYTTAAGALMVVVID